ncbi:MAG: ABC transporter ATP-binding protein [Bacteroidota bacterium]|nr:ABC transporter ATP-binding protein [Bacteroidota bacterium]
MVQVENLTYDYPSHRALDGLSFSIPSGSITALVGPNGAGKTTLMRCLAGLTRPLMGSIMINGTDVLEDPRKVHRQIGFLADFFGLYDKLTIYEALTYFAKAHDVPNDEVDKRVLSIIERLHLSDKTHADIGHLSRGMKQRVAIGQTMVHNPGFLILDEPASGLDPEARHDLANLFKELNKDGITLLVSSHILAELDEYSNNLVIMREGKIVDNDFFEQKNTDTRHLLLKLTQPNTELLSILEAETQISNIEATETSASFDFDGTETQQAELMVTLIRKGLSVLSFAEEKVNMQDKYLNTIKQK